MTLRVAAILAVLLAALVTGGPTSAAAADTDALVAVEISAVTPANPQPGGQLKVSGVLRNISSVRLRDVGARMQVSTVPLTGAQEVLAVAGGASVRIGDVVTQRPGFVTLEPEGQTPFELTAPLDSIGFTEPGVYEVRIDSVDGAAAILGTRSTTVPWFPPGSVPDPASVVFLWPLFGVPARDADDVFLTTAVAAEVNPAGRLRTLVDTGAAHAGQVSWVIDPQTLQSVELLTRPYQLLVDDGTAAAQPADAGAAAWLAVVNRATGGTADVTAAGYADPDSVAEVSAGLLSDLVLATTTSSALLSEQLGRSVRGAFSWPANGSLDQPTLNALRGAGVQHVVLASDVVGGGAGAPLVRLSTDSGPITAVVGDGELAVALGSMTNNPATAVQARQLFLSLVALRALADGGPTLVAAPPGDWAPSQPALGELLTALDGAEYARLQTLGATVAALEATAPEGELLTSSEVTTAEQLSADHLAGVAAAGDTLAEIGDIAVQPGDSLRGYREALLRSSSAAWRKDPAMGSLLLGRTTAQIEAQRDKVRISSAGTVSFSGEQGRVPVTVSNDLTVAVTVGLTLSASPSYRIEPAPIDPITIPPGQRLSLEVPVRVVGSDPLTVTAQLLTPQGELYEPGEDFELRTSAYSRVAAWAVALAFGALILMAGASVVRRVRGKGGSDNG